MGIISTIKYTMTCCILSEMAEIISPTPIRLKIKSISARYKVTREPAKGIWNQNLAMQKRIVLCTSPISMGGTALPSKISAGDRGVTISWSKVPCSLSRAMDMPASSSTCTKAIMAISPGEKIQRVI